MSNFENLNHLPTEVKLLIVNGQALVDKTKIAMKEKRCDIDMTMKFQLKDDCKRVEKCIKKIASGKAVKTDMKELEVAIVKLQTTAKAIVGVF